MFPSNMLLLARVSFFAAPGQLVAITAGLVCEFLVGCADFLGRNYWRIYGRCGAEVFS